MGTRRDIMSLAESTLSHYLTCGHVTPCLCRWWSWACKQGNSKRTPLTVCIIQDYIANPANIDIDGLSCPTDVHGPRSLVVDAGLCYWALQQDSASPATNPNFLISAPLTFSPSSFHPLFLTPPLPPLSIIQSHTLLHTHPPLLAPPPLSLTHTHSHSPLPSLPHVSPPLSPLFFLFMSGCLSMGISIGKPPECPQILMLMPLPLHEIISSRNPAQGPLAVRDYVRLHHGRNRQTLQASVSMFQSSHA